MVVRDKTGVVPLVESASEKLKQEHAGSVQSLALVCEKQVCVWPLPRSDVKPSPPGWPSDTREPRETEASVVCPALSNNRPAKGQTAIADVVPVCPSDVNTDSRRGLELAEYVGRAPPRATTWPEGVAIAPNPGGEVLWCAAR